MQVVKENTKRTKWSFCEVLMIVSGFIIFSAFALPEKYVLWGKIILAVGGICFLVAFIWMLIKKAIQEQETEKKISNEA